MKKKRLKDYDQLHPVTIQKRGNVFLRERGADSKAIRDITMGLSEFERDVLILGLAMRPKMRVRRLA